jgi:hypothetical protein
MRYAVIRRVLGSVQCDLAIYWLPQKSVPLTMVHGARAYWHRATL